MEERFTRQDFNRCLGLGALALGGAVFLKGERLPYKPINTAALDFAPGFLRGTFCDDIWQDVFANNGELIREVLGNNYVSPTEILWRMTFADKENFFTELVKENPQAAMIYGAIYAVQNHGREVIKTMRQGWEIAGHDTDPYLFPLQLAIEPEDIHFLLAGEGDIGLSLTIKAQNIIEYAKRIRFLHPEIKVLNLSFPVGTTTAFYFDHVKEDHDGWGTGVTVQEPYTHGDREGNFAQLVEIAKELDEMVVVAAAGNIEGSIKDLMEKVPVPPNLVMAAQWDPDKSKPLKIEGAHVYPDHRNLGKIGGGSSRSAAITSVPINLEIQRKVQIKDVRDNLLKECKVSYGENGSTWPPFRVLDKSLIQAVAV